MAEADGHEQEADDAGQDERGGDQNDHAALAPRLRVLVDRLGRIAHDRPPAKTVKPFDMRISLLKAARRTAALGSDTTRRAAGAARTNFCDVEEEKDGGRDRD
jgi:hypothetical protein